MGDICYFVGRAAWQYCASVTVHIGDEYCSKSDALALLIEARGMTIAQADAAKHETPTDGRFLAATSDIADPF